MADSFPWTIASEQAAQLIAEGDLTQDAIAEKVGVVRMTVYNWRKNPEFAARVEQHLAAFRDEVRRIGIATKEYRIKALDDRYRKLNKIVADRIASGKWAEIPGGDSGLILHKILKRIGRGENAVTIESYEIDSALMAELRAIELQAAKELGQLVDKTDLSGSTVVEVRYADDQPDHPPPAPWPGPSALRVDAVQRALYGPQVGENDVRS